MEYCSTSDGAPFDIVDAGWCLDQVGTWSDTEGLRPTAVSQERPQDAGRWKKKNVIITTIEVMRPSFADPVLKGVLKALPPKDDA